MVEHLSHGIRDVIIVGAGAVGSAAARQLGRAGARVTVLEQFRLLHERGSSHGESRLYRWCDTNASQARLGQHAWQHWKHLEEAAGEELLRTVGSLEFGKRNAPALKKLLEVSESNDIRMEVLNSAEIQGRFPGFQLEEDVIGLYEEHGSVINAGRTLQALQRLGREAEVEFVENATVAGLTQDASSGRMKVTLADGRSLEGESVVVAAGAYASPLLKQLDLDFKLTAWRMSYGYYKIHSEFLYMFRPGCMPVWRSFLKRTYGFPIHEMEGYVKVARHNAAPQDQLASPIDNFTPNPDQVQETGSIAAEYFRGVVQDDFIAPRCCYYTMTNDEQFVVGLAPTYGGRVAVSTGCNGAMFKHVPLLGVILSELVQDGVTKSFDIGAFSPTRESLWEGRGSGLNFQDVS